MRTIVYLRGANNFVLGGWKQSCTWGVQTTAVTKCEEKLTLEPSFVAKAESLQPGFQNRNHAVSWASCGWL